MSQWLIRIPNEHRTDEIAAALLDEMPWMAPVTKIIWCAMRRSVREGWPALRVEPFRTTGPPGIGKSYFARILGVQLSTATTVIEATGENASFGVVGSQRGWGGSHPGRLIETVLQSGGHHSAHGHACAGRCRSGTLEIKGRDTMTGLVITRQRPGTASGVVLLALEDETGTSNEVIWKKTYKAFRKAVIAGRIQRDGPTSHLLAEWVEDISFILATLGRSRVGDDARRIGLSRNTITKYLNAGMIEP